MRVFELTPSGFTTSLANSPATTGTLSEMKSICPPTRSVAGSYAAAIGNVRGFDARLFQHCRNDHQMRRRAYAGRAAAFRCTPGCFAYASISAGKVEAGKDLRTTSTCGAHATAPTGTKSLAGS